MPRFLVKRAEMQDWRICVIRSSTFCMWKSVPSKLHICDFHEATHFLGEIEIVDDWCHRDGLEENTKEYRMERYICLIKLFVYFFNAFQRTNNTYRLSTSYLDLGHSKCFAVKRQFLKKNATNRVERFALKVRKAISIICWKKSVKRYGKQNNKKVSCVYFTV